MTTQKHTPEFNQDEKTKQFVEQANTLIKEGKAKNYTEIARNIEWPKSSISDVINGRKNVPFEVLKRFSDYYNLGAKDWRDEKIEMLQEMNNFLKEQLENKKALDRELLEMRKEFKQLSDKVYSNLDTFQEFAVARMAYLKTILRNQLHYRSHVEKIPFDVLDQEADKVLAEETRKILKENIFS